MNQSLLLSLHQHSLALLAQEGLSPVLGAEIECYVELASDEASHINDFFADIDAQAQQWPVKLLRIEQERGKHQFEFVLAPFVDVTAGANTLAAIVDSVTAKAAACGVSASFAAKPYAEQPGSALHTHLHLRYQGYNAFQKHDDYISDALRYALGGLCSLTPYIMPILCPTQEGYQRYHDTDHVPNTISWGANNRTCAIRIPSTPAWEDKRLEWRVPAADADPYAVFVLMCYAVAVGIDQRIEPPPQTYGLAGRDASLMRLPLSLDKAWCMAKDMPACFAPLSVQWMRDLLAK